MSRDGAVQPAAERVIWITPDPAGREASSSVRVARELGGRAEITQIGLAVWDTAPDDRYDLAVEVAAVAASAEGLARYHLFGFSAGATVALAAALALREADAGSPVARRRPDARPSARPDRNKP